MPAQALEQSTLEGKDKEQLLQIAKALGVKGVSKLKKADLVDKIIDATGGAEDDGSDEAPAPETAAPEPAPAPAAEPAPTIEVTDGARGFSKPRSTNKNATNGADVPAPKPAADASSAADAGAADASAADDGGVVLGPDGEPLADWEIELHKQGVSTDTTPTDATDTKVHRFG